MSDPSVRPPGSLDEQDTRLEEVSEPGARLQARPTSTPSRRPNMQVRTGQPGSLTSSSGGSSVTKEAPEMATLRRVCYDRLRAGLPECQTALDSLVAALVAATARADQAERAKVMLRQTADAWRHHSGRTAGQYRAAEARAAELETALSEIAESYPWEPYADNEVVRQPHESLSGVWYTTQVPTNRRIARSVLARDGAVGRGQ